MMTQSAQQQPRFTPRQIRWLTIGAAVGLLGLAFVLRLPLVTYNVPVVAHPDERGTLGLLWRLRNESINPHFFAYPTLYFYVTMLWVRGAEMGQMLVWARLLNLLLGCGIGAASGWLSWQVGRSCSAALLTIALVLFSPELIFNTSYLAVDALFVLLSVTALGLWLRFWHTGSTRLWIAAAILSGLALGTKYNAVIVLVSVIFVTWWSNEIEGDLSARWLQTYLSRRWQIVLPLIVAAALGGLSLLDPAQLVTLMPNRASIEPQDIEFVAEWLTLFRMAAIAAVAGSGLIALFPQHVRRFFLLRPYLALGIAVAVFFAVTPFALLSWQEFLLDVGTELKKNALSGDQHYWLQYGGWLRQFESLFALLFAPLGLLVALRQRPRASLLLAIYLLLNYLAIGSATRGFARYLSPLLPVLYVLAAIGMTFVAAQAGQLIAQSAQIGRNAIQIAVLALILFGVGIELTPKLQAVLSRSTTTDYQHAGYTFVVEQHGVPERAFFAGFVPMFELRTLGVQHIPIVVADDTWRAEGVAGDLLMVDTERNRLLSAATRQSLTLLWSSDEELGLHIYTIGER